MQIFTRVEEKLLESCDDGELVRFGFESQSRLAIVLKTVGFGEKLVLLLAAEDPELNFRAWQTSPHFSCASYGTDWVIELIDDEESLPNNHLDESTLGTVHQISVESAAITIRGLNPPSIFALDLGRLAAVAGERHKGVLFRKWRIWKTAEDAGKPKARPIFSYGLDDESPAT